MSTTEDGLQDALRAFVDGVVAQNEGFGFSARAFSLDFLSDAVNDAMYGADFVGALEELELIDRFVDHVRTALVIACRSTGVGWDDIGAAMGRDRQWAWRTYREVADVTDDLDEQAIREFKKAIPDFEALGLKDADAEPQLKQAVRLIERQAERTYEQVERAIALTRDSRRRTLMEAEAAERRANRPGRRPGPQGARSADS